MTLDTLQTISQEIAERAERKLAAAPALEPYHVTPELVRAEYFRRGELMCGYAAEVVAHSAGVVDVNDASRDAFVWTWSTIGRDVFGAWDEPRISTGLQRGRIGSSSSRVVTQ